MLCCIMIPVLLGGGWTTFQPSSCSGCSSVADKKKHGNGMPSRGYSHAVRAIYTYIPPPHLSATANSRCWLCLGSAPKLLKSLRCWPHWSDNSPERRVHRQDASSLLQFWDFYHDRTSSTTVQVAIAMICTSIAAQLAFAVTSSQPCWPCL